MVRNASPLAPHAGAVLVAVAVLSAAACATGQAAPKTPGGEPIVIGAVLPLTGELAVFGASAFNGMRMAVDEANAAGGALGRPLELLPRDDKGDVEAGLAAYRASMDIDGAVAIAGSLTSKISLAGAPSCQAAGVPMVSPTSTNPLVTEIGDYIFRAAFIDPYQGPMAAGFAVDSLGARTAACLFNGGIDYCVGIAETFRAEFERRGGTVTAFAAHGWYPEDAADLVAKVVAGNPDLIVLADYYNEAADLAMMARALGYQGVFLGPDGWDSPQLVDIAGHAIEGSYFITHWHPESASPESLRFADAYRFRYGADPDTLAVCGYESVKVIIEGIRAAGGIDGAALRDAIAATKLVLPTGRFAFDGKRNPVKSAAVVVIRNGRFDWFATIDPAAE